MTSEKRDVLVLSDIDNIPAQDESVLAKIADPDWNGERDIVRALVKLGHRVRFSGIYDTLEPLLDTLREKKPDLVFNLAEGFRGVSYYDRDIPALLELLDLPYTGVGPAGLMLCRNKGVTKKVLSYHRIKSPEFAILPRGKGFVLPHRVAFPAIVKPLRGQSSYGISKSSVVEDEKSLEERVRYMHEKMDQSVIVEHFVKGRELYVSVLGDSRLSVLPLRELAFGKVPEDELKLATFKAKWDLKYRRQWGIRNTFARGITPELSHRIIHLCKKAFRALNLRGYARFDLRLTEAGEVVLLEANANPFLARGEDFARSARLAGYSYDKLIQKIVDLGLHSGRYQGGVTVPVSASRGLAMVDVSE